MRLMFSDLQSSLLIRSFYSRIVSNNCVAIFGVMLIACILLNSHSDSELMIRITKVLFMEKEPFEALQNAG